MNATTYSDVLTSVRPQAQATGTITGHAAEFVAVHRQENDTPATADLTMTVPMSLEDITAALWIVVDGGYALSDLREEGPEHLHGETVFAEGASELDSVHFGPDDIRSGSNRHAGSWRG